MEPHVLDEYFTLRVSADKMKATLNMTKKMNEESSPFTYEHLLRYLQDHQIKFGVCEGVLRDIANHPNDMTYPLEVASGRKPEIGENGYLKHEAYVEKKNFSTQEKIDFRNVQTIPTVTNGQKVAQIVAPADGIDGENVLGEPVPSKKGRPFKLRPTKSISINEKTGAVTARIDGQISATARTINVFPVYEVKGDLDLKTGNIDFIGNVTIRGNVPTGFQIHAKGDVTIYGMVEGSEVKAGGSVHIIGGFVGMNRGVVEAGNDVHIGYINQGKVTAAKSIYVNKDILHSKCNAGEMIICERGHVVGGALSAGTSIIVHEAGNKLQSSTEFFLGVDQNSIEKQRELTKMKRETAANLSKLNAFGEKLEEKQKTLGLSSKERVLLLRQKSNLKQLLQQYAEITDDLHELEALLEHAKEASLSVTGTLFQNTDIHFGKYRSRVKALHKHVIIKLIHSEISIQPLS